MSRIKKKYRVKINNYRFIEWNWKYGRLKEILRSMKEQWKIVENDLIVLQIFEEWRWIDDALLTYDYI